MIEIQENKEGELQITLGCLFEIPITVVLDARERPMLDNVNLEDLPPEVKEQIKEHTRLLEESNKTLGRFMGEVIRQDFEISRHQYYELLALKETLLYNRSIPNRRFLAYDPERDCECRLGETMGLCRHFWGKFYYFSLSSKNW